MRGKVSALIVLSFIFAVMPVFAQVTDIELTDASGNTDFKDPPHIFNPGETPWLYILLPNASSVITGDWWLSGLKSSTEKGFDSSNAADPYFNYFSDGGALWISRKEDNDKPGEWHIQSIEADGSRIPTHSINYKLNNTVVPEPVSSSLFLIGMSALGLWRLRKKG
ncbi:MAG: PEP-CTERM sorting domain-containing protein [Candidatus Omnitrophica bacterium]|nr:PEP-CTERM sorting domain-containing protein [Candidatus Omnitrophota bacterium]